MGVGDSRLEWRSRGCRAGVGDCHCEAVTWIWQTLVGTVPACPPCPLRAAHAGQLAGGC